MIIRNKVKNIKKREGFTLIELTVALFVFSLVTLAVLGIFIQSINSQRKAIVIQNIQENLRYAIDVAGKEIRMSSIASDEGASLILDINHPVNGAVRYEFDDVNKKLMRNNQQISSSQIELTGQFYIVKTNIKPRVTIAMKAKGKNIPALLQSEINLQTTISIR